MVEYAQRVKVATQLSQVGEAELIEFVDDTISFLKGQRVPFLSKYNEAFGGSSRLVVPARDFVIDVMQLALRKTAAASNLDSFKQTVGTWIQTYLTSEDGELAELDFKFAEIVAVASFSRR